MKQVELPSAHKPSGTDWQILGELELAIGEAHKDVISAWIQEVLGSLKVHSNFKDRILTSTQEAVTRASQSLIPALKFEHVHLLVFAPAAGLSAGQSWGFFRIEKYESTAPSECSREHAIEFYLYPEGQ